MKEVLSECFAVKCRRKWWRVNGTRWRWKIAKMVKRTIMKLMRSQLMSQTTLLRDEGGEEYGKEAA